jgi:hypothetical protein
MLKTPGDRGEPLCGILPACKLVAVEELGRLRAPQPVLTPGFQEALIDGNPWLRALQTLGHELAVDPRMTPVEEGETSLNCNSHQALASLRTLLAGREQGLRLTVVGNLAAGNHGLDHTLALLALSFADPRHALAALGEVFGDAALASAGPLLAGCRSNVRKTFHHLPAAVRRARALRLPAVQIDAPGADRLDGLGETLGFDPWLRRLVTAVREAMDPAGLRTVADLFILLRGALIQHLGARLGATGLPYIPTSLEHLIARGTGAELAGLSLRTLAARWHAALGLAAEGRERPQGQARFGRARFRVLNYYDPVALFTRGGRPGGRLRAGWGSLSASFETGGVLTDRNTAELAELPVAELLGRGYGLSGKLTYLAVRAVNGGRVCNQVFASPKSDVFAALADPAHPGLVLALRWIDVNGLWQDPGPRRPPPLDLLAVAQWLGRCPDPPRTLERILGSLRDLGRDPRGPRAGLLLGEPGSFQIS